MALRTPGGQDVLKRGIPVVRRAGPLALSAGPLNAGGGSASENDATGRHEARAGPSMAAANR